jgi:hypothetical protein
MRKRFVHKSTISFVWMGNAYSFCVYHNMEGCGISIKNVFINWVYQTNEFTPGFFADFSQNYNESVICFTQEAIYGAIAETV